MFAKKYALVFPLFSLLLFFSACSTSVGLTSTEFSTTPPNSLNPVSSATNFIPTFSPTPKPSRTPSAIPTATSSLIPLDYSRLPPLSTLIINGSFFPNFNPYMPEILFQKPPVPFDQTKDIADKCYVDCVKFAWSGSLGTLTIILIRANNHSEALHILAEEYGLFKKKYSETLLGFVDEYTGEGDNIWAGAASATPAYAEAHGSIFTLLIWEIKPDGFDIDTPHFLGEMSCLAQYQFDWIDKQVDPEFVIREPDNSCMITH